jgi:hypothetical protein
MTSYVLGFLFEPGFRRVALLRKTHGPGEMAGRLNGIQLGVETDWMAFCSMRCEDEWICDCFVAVIPSFDRLPLRNDVKEEVVRVAPNTLTFHDHMLNLKWLIPLAMESSASGVMSEVHYPIGVRGDR